MRSEIEKMLEYLPATDGIWKVSPRNFQMKRFGDLLPNGHHVVVKRLFFDETVSFYQSGCFRGMIFPEHVSFVSGPEDKEVSLKQVWIEE